MLNEVRGTTTCDGQCSRLQVHLHPTDLDASLEAVSSCFSLRFLLSQEKQKKHVLDRSTDKYIRCDFQHFGRENWCAQIPHKYRPMHCAMAMANTTASSRTILGDLGTLSICSKGVLLVILKFRFDAYTVFARYCHRLPCRSPWRCVQRRGPSYLRTRPLTLHRLTVYPPYDTHE